jgi:Domain of unknown function (DUF6985)
MEVPGLGKVTKDEEFGWYTSNPIAIPMFGGKQCRVVLKGYDEDANRHEFHAAIANFLSGRPEVLQSAERDLYRYYEDFQDLWENGRHAYKSAKRQIQDAIHVDTCRGGSPAPRCAALAEASSWRTSADSGRAMNNQSAPKKRP